MGYLVSEYLSSRENIAPVQVEPTPEVSRKKARSSLFLKRIVPSGGGNERVVTINLPGSNHNEFEPRMCNAAPHCPPDARRHAANAAPALGSVRAGSALWPDLHPITRWGTEAVLLAARGGGTLMASPPLRLLRSMFLAGGLIAFAGSL